MHFGPEDDAGVSSSNTPTPAPDLDARVAANLDLIENIFSEYGTRREDGLRAVREIRAELQKPALHEPVTDAELNHALDVYSADEISIGHGWRKAIEAVLQGRAKPALQANAARAQEEITDADRWNHVLQHANEDIEGYSVLVVLTIEEQDGLFDDYLERATKAVDAAIHASKGEKT